MAVNGIDPSAKTPSRIRRNWARTTKGAVTSTLQTVQPVIVNGTGKLAINIASAGGIDPAVGALKLLLDTNSGLSVSTNGLKLGVVTTKGDLLSFGTFPTRLPVGSNGQFLTADSTQTTGLKWVASPATPPGGSSTQVQFNDAGAFGGDAALRFNKATGALLLGSAAGQGIIQLTGMADDGSTDSSGPSIRLGHNSVLNRQLLLVDPDSGAFILMLPDSVSARMFVATNQSKFTMGNNIECLGWVSTTDAFKSSATITTVNGSISGNIQCAQPFQGSSYKKVVIYCNALNGNAVYTFPTAFTYVPDALGTNAASATAITTTSVTVTSPASGYLFLEGY